MNMLEKDPPLRLRVSISATLSFSLLAASFPIALRMGTLLMPPLFLGVLRLSVMTLLTVLWFQFRRKEWFPKEKKARVFLVWAGLAKIAGTLGIYLGMARTEAVRGAVMMDTSAIWILLLAHFMISDDQINLSKIFSLFLGLAGVALVMREDWGGASGNFLGDALCLGGALGVAAMSVYEKRSVRAGATPMQVLFVAVAANVLAFLPLSFFLESWGSVHWSPFLFFVLFWLIVPCGMIQFYLRRWLLQFLPVTWFIPWTFFSRIATACLAVWLLQESITKGLVGGFILVFLSLMVSTRTWLDATDSSSPVSL